MTYLETFIISLSSYPAFAPFLAGFIAGETVIFSLAFLSAAGLFPIPYLFFFSFLGVFISDIIWFLIGRWKIIHNIHNIEKFSNIYQKIDSFIIELSNESLFRTILYSRFLYGARTLTLIYLGLKKADFKKVVASLFAIHLVAVSLVVVVGWYAGKGFIKLLDIFENVKAIITFGILLLIIIILLRRGINKFVIKKRNIMKKK